MYALINLSKEMAKSIDWLIAGLGNPGKKYAYNRHNIGWMVVSALAERFKKPIMSLSNIYLQTSLVLENQLILAIMPTTYMNMSGEAVSKALKLYNLEPEKLIVICDEYNFPLGKVHIKLGGSDGGHNGIASIINELETDKFWRLRCGIGRNFESGGLVDYVLSDFNEDEIDERDKMIAKAVDAIEAFFRLGYARAMSLINSGQLWNKDNNNENTND